MSKIAGELNAEMTKAVRDEYRVLFAEMVRKTGSNQSVLDRLVQEVYNLRAQVSELEASPLSEEALDILRSKNAQLEKELAVMHAKHPENSCYDVPTWEKLNAQIDTLAAQNEALRSALEHAQQSPHPFGRLQWYADVLNLPNLASEVLKRRDAEIDLAADRLEVLEREHAEFFERWHDERRKRETLANDVERCYRTLLSEPDTKGALFKAENILREALAEANAKTHNAKLTGDPQLHRGASSEQSERG